MARTRSGGPRTRVGKIRSSLNALRHGLAARQHRQAAPAGAVDRLAQAICGGKDDAELLAAAQAIAESEFVLHAIRQRKIIVIERLKDATAVALRKGDNSFDLAKARFFEAWLAHREIQKLVPQVMKKFELQGPPVVLDGDLVPIQIKALLEEEEPTDEEQARALELARKELKRRERNEHEGLEEAIPDLIRLERYERRARSRRKRAIREFVLIQFSRSWWPVARRRHPRNDVIHKRALT
jgi:hypothetical protein